MKTSVIIDDAEVLKAAKILGTSGRSETLRAAISEVIRRKKLSELAKSSVDYKRFDPDVLAKVDEAAWR